MKAEILCEYLKNPVGIDCVSPRFSWILSGMEKGDKQNGYNLLVSSDENFTDIMWSENSKSSETVNISYKGPELKPGKRYFYKVSVSTDMGHQVESERGYFLTGLREKEWRGAWVGGPMLEEDTFWFRWEFDEQSSFYQVLAFVASPNYYVLTVNGQKATDSVLDNAWTDTDKTLLYRTYDITKLFREGKNAVGMEVGNGWHAMEMGFRQCGKGEHLFSLQLLITDINGKETWIRPDYNSWIYTVDGPLRMNSIYQGEDYDARKELESWDCPEYDKTSSDVQWRYSVEFEPPAGTLKSQILEPIKVIGYRKAQHIYRIADGSWTFDMGQNFAGWAKLQVKAPAGTEIVMEFAELENEDHSLNKISLRGVRAEDHYICKGQGTEIYEPSFTYHGFRYIQVRGLPNEPDEETVIGCVVRSAVEKIGDFSCSEPLLNQLQKNIQWTEESNLHGIPTDCPQRDERLGWLNDMTVRNENALYSYRLIQLYTKWLQDIKDTQGEKTGAITDTAPYRRFGQRPADPVSSSFLLIPWNLYCHYGDIQIIRDNYSAMKRWVAYLIRNSQNYILPYAPFGDWAAPVGGTDLNSIGGGAASFITPFQLMATGYLYYDCQLMEKMALLLGQKEDADYYSKQKEKVASAFQEAFYNREEKYYARNSQAGNTFPLYLKLVPPEDKKDVLMHLVKDVMETHNVHLTTGNLCSRYIIEVLLTEGYENVAYDLLTQTTYPSWGYMIENGATTIWERWEKVTEEGVLSKMASYNHPMNGAVGVSFYKYLAGIQVDEKEPGFKNVIVHPVIPEKLKSAQASIQTIRGTVASKWSKEKEKLELKVTIPFNCTGEIYMPIENNAENCSIYVDGVCISKNGIAEKELPFAKLQETADKHWIFKVGSGNYTFISIKNQ